MRAEHEEQPDKSNGEAKEKTPQIEYLESIYGVGRVWYNKEQDIYYTTSMVQPKNITIEIGFIKDI